MENAKQKLLVLFLFLVGRRRKEGKKVRKRRKEVEFILIVKVSQDKVI